MIDGSPIQKFKVCLVFSAFTLFLFFIPYISFMLLMFSSLLFIYSDRGNNRIALFFFLISSFFISSIPISTQAIINDKLIYYDYMKDNSSTPLLQWLSNYTGFDFFSYLLMKFSTIISGVNNGAFFIIYCICYISIFFGFYKIIGKLSAFVIFLFIPQYVFDSYYANTIRQGIGLSLLVLAISDYKKVKQFLYVILSVASHFSFFIFTPFFLIYKRLLKLKLFGALFIYLSTLIVGKFIIPLLFSSLASYNSFFGGRVSAYKDGDFGLDPVKRLILTVVFCIVVEGGFWYSKRITNLPTKVLEKICLSRAIFLYTACTYFFTMSFEEVSNRYSFNEIPFFILFICSIIPALKYRVKVFYLLALLFLGTILYISMAITLNNALYYGDYQSVFTDSLINILQKISVL